MNKFFSRERESESGTRNWKEAILLPFISFFSLVALEIRIRQYLNFTSTERNLFKGLIYSFVNRYGFGEREKLSGDGEAGRRKEQAREAEGVEQNENEVKWNDGDACNMVIAAAAGCAE